VSRSERLTKLKRDLAELRSRLSRIDGETFLARQQIEDLERQTIELAAEGPVQS
jgi:hypothetical protein